MTTDPPGPQVIDTIELADGRQMVIRTTTADDAEMITELYRQLSSDDRHRRFFGAFTPHVEWCRSWATVGDRGGFGVVAVVESPSGQALAGEVLAGQMVAGEVLAGEAGYAMRSDGDGDLAVTVAEPWRGWLGAYLVDVLVRHAAASGVANLQADILLENGPMLALLQRRGPVAMAHDDGEVRVSIGTSGTPPSWPPDDERQRVLVEVAGRRWAGEDAAHDAGLSTAMCSGPAGRSRTGCPVLNGGTCPLADGADAIIVLLDPDDAENQELIAAHRQRSPGTPVLVRRSPTRSVVGDTDCIEVDPDTRRAVAQVLALLGHSPDAT